MADHDEHGEHWTVFVEWSGRKAMAPLSNNALSARRARYRERSRNSDSGIPDGCDTGLDFDLGAIVIGIVVTLIIIAIWPFIGPVLAAVVIFAVAIIEVTIVLMVAAAAIVARTLLGRPWRVLAINRHGATWSWKQVGWGEAHRLVERLQGELEAGAHPEALAPGNSTAEGRSQLPDTIDTGLAGKTWVRVASKAIAVILAICAAITVLIRLG